MKAATAVNLIGLSLLTGCFLFHSSSGSPSASTSPPPSSQFRSPWESWIMFDQPDNTVQLGDAWNIVDQIDRSCFAHLQASDSIVPSNSWSEYSLHWADTANAALRISVAKAFGFGASVAAARSGDIQFYGVTVRQAVSPGPTVATCGDVVGGVPRRPAVIALVGADSMRFSLSQNLNAQAAAQITAGGNGTFDSDTHAEVATEGVNCNSCCWFSAHSSACCSGASGRS